MWSRFRAFSGVDVSTHGVQFSMRSQPRAGIRGSLGLLYQSAVVRLEGTRNEPPFLVPEKCQPSDCVASSGPTHTFPGRGLVAGTDSEWAQDHQRVQR